MGSKTLVIAAALTVTGSALLIGSVGTAVAEVPVGPMACPRRRLRLRLLGIVGGTWPDCGHEVDLRMPTITLQTVAIKSPA
jgi:hypothetical protein